MLFEFLKISIYNYNCSLLVYRNTIIFLYVDLISCDLVEVITDFFVVVDT